MGVSKIVITGGPCAGKTTAMSWIQNEFNRLGYKVIFIAETATELITSGVAPWMYGCNLDFQRCQVRLQLAKEEIYAQAASRLPDKNILMVCDRGVLDNKAYMTKAEFDTVISELGRSEVELRDGYDAVFHLVTAAKGAEKFYTTLNNTARTETIEAASALDDRLISAWTGHPHFRVIDNSTGFEEKMKRLIAEISAFLGEPVPLEIERKFLIKYPDLNWLENNPSCHRSEIIQTYLNSSGEDEVRIRQRGSDGNYIYFQTVKHRIDELKRVEVERRLSQDEYLSLLMDADTSRHQIRKTRYCLTYESQYFELDVYPFWKDRAIIEIELSREDQKIEFPEQIKVIREVTGDERYKNASLSRNIDIN